MSGAWRLFFAVLRGVALLGALAGFGDLLFFGDKYQAGSPLFYRRCVESTWMLVVLAVYPRMLLRLSRLFLLPLLLMGLLAAYNLIWLSQNEVLTVASGEASLKIFFALVALGFVLESIVALLRQATAVRVKE